MKVIYIDGKSISDISALYAQFKAQGGFPDYFGANLDALHDCLTETAEGFDICIAHKDALREAVGDKFNGLMHVLEDSAAECECVKLRVYDDELSDALADFEALQAKLSAYDHALSLLSYDGATTAPKATAANRGHSMAILSEECYKLSTGDEMKRLIEYLDPRSAELDSRHARQVYLLGREMRRISKIPMDEYVAFEELVVESDDVWHTAKEKSDFAMFAPYLEKIVDYTRRFANYCAPEKDPYDYWLNEYEEGIDRAYCDNFFSVLRAHIVPLLQKVQAAPQFDDSILLGDFPDDKQLLLAKKLMALMGIDSEHCGLSTTEHPFTTSLGSHFDVRITTHFMRENFASSMYSVIHEGGHALYDMGSDDALAYTELDGGVSMGIHESQSRFYENLLGRSRAFIEKIFPMIAEVFPEQLKGRTPEELYRAVNRAEPSLIRTEADELTYCLHVMIRYELEKRMISGELSISELPAEWNRMYKEYLGVDVPDDKHGVLQDSHWSGGAIGYFPSYALGSAYGAQLLRRMRREIDVDAALRAGDFAAINEWNREHIWKYGCMIPPAELFRQAAGEEFDPTAYTDYLEQKFGELYGV